MKKQKGQAIIPLLIVVVIALGLGTIGIELAISNILADRYHFNAIVGYYATESALEESFLRWLRNPSYTGESLVVDDLECVTEVSGSSPWTFEASCTSDHFVRHLSATVDWVNGEMVVDNVSESS